MTNWIKAHPFKATVLGLIGASTVLVASGLTPLFAFSFTPDTMSTISTERRTHCIGRYLVDLPADFHLLSGGWGDIDFYYGLDKDFETVHASVRQEAFTPQDFAARVEARETELRTTINIVTNRPMLLDIERLPRGAVMFRRMEDPNYDISMKSEVHQLVGDRYVSFEQESSDSKSPLGSKSTRNVDPAPAEARLRMISSKLQPVGANVWDTPEGFCFQGVVFDIGQSDEIAKFDFESTAIPDLNFSVNYHAVTGQPSEGLFEREDRYVDLSLKLMSAKMRRGTRLLGGMNAEESLIKTVRPVVQHVFDTETRTAKRNIAQPFIGVSMSTGNNFTAANGEEQKAGESSLSDEQALGLWDEITNSVRLHPGALPDGMTSMGETTPICRFGDVCPRSGYWMKQVTRVGFRFNSYHAHPLRHLPFMEGMTFFPSTVDEMEDRPYTVWGWRREIDENGEKYAWIEQTYLAELNGQSNGRD